MKIRCAWHPKYFGYEKYLGYKEPYYNNNITDGMCRWCEYIFWFKATIHKLKRRLLWTNKH